MKTQSSDITLQEIQEWEKSFVKKKGIALKEEIATKIAICKLTEEVGEVAKDLLEGNWREIQAEVADVIVFACKIANIAEKFHKSDSLTEVFKRKINYCETRQYNQKSNKLDKPEHEEFK